MSFWVSVHCSDTQKYINLSKKNKKTVYFCLFELKKKSQKNKLGSHTLN